MSPVRDRTRLMILSNLHLIGTGYFFKNIKFDGALTG